ncbi:MAG: hypothetical protein AB8B64_11140 [Granulosicoccus sp.]
MERTLVLHSAEREGSAVIASMERAQSVTGRRVHSQRHLIRAVVNPARALKNGDRANVIHVPGRTRHWAIAYQARQLLQQEFQ